MDRWILSVKLAITMNFTVAVGGNAQNEQKGRALSPPPSLHNPTHPPTHDD